MNGKITQIFFETPEVMPPPDCAEYAVIPDFTVAPDYT
jgi:hypothetical protein